MSRASTVPSAASREASVRITRRRARSFCASTGFVSLERGRRYSANSAVLPAWCFPGAALRSCCSPKGAPLALLPNSKMHISKLPLSVQMALILDTVRGKSPRYRILVNADSLPVSSRTLPALARCLVNEAFEHPARTRRQIAWIVHGVH